jgi:hypothetical protein
MTRGMTIGRKQEEEWERNMEEWRGGNKDTKGKGEWNNGERKLFQCEGE